MSYSIFFNAYFVGIQWLIVLFSEVLTKHNYSEFNDNLVEQNIEPYKILHF
jgi:hypothetical protein